MPRVLAFLEKGGRVLYNEEAIVKPLEENPLFNAGKWAVLGNEEPDAAIMNGKTLEAGSPASIKTIKNPGGKEIICT